MKNIREAKFTEKPSNDPYGSLLVCTMKSPPKVMTFFLILSNNIFTISFLQSMVGEWEPPGDCGIKGPPKDNAVLGHVLANIFSIVAPPTVSRSIISHLFTFVLFNVW